MIVYSKCQYHDAPGCVIFVVVDRPAKAFWIRWNKKGNAVCARPELHEYVETENCMSDNGGCFARS